MTIKSQRTPRDLPREREFLSRSSVMYRDGHRFVAHATERLAAGETKFGGQWTSLELLEFARELSEEAADLGAWAALADQAADLQGVPVSHRPAVRLLLIRVARHGAAAHEGVERLRQLLEKIQEDPGRPRAVEAS